MEFSPSSIKVRLISIGYFYLSFANHGVCMHVTLGHAAVVINMFRNLCMQILKADTSVKDSLAGKRQRCAWSFPYALAVVKNWAFS